MFLHAGMLNQRTQYVVLSCSVHPGQISDTNFSEVSHDSFHLIHDFFILFLAYLMHRRRSRCSWSLVGNGCNFLLNSFDQFSDFLISGNWIHKPFQGGRRTLSQSMGVRGLSKIMVSKQASAQVCCYRAMFLNLFLLLNRIFHLLHHLGICLLMQNTCLLFRHTIRYNFPPKLLLHGWWLAR